MSFYLTLRPKDNFEKFRTSSNGGLDLAKYTEKMIYYRCMVFNNKEAELKDMDINIFMLNTEKDIDKLITYYTYDAKACLTNSFDTEDGSYKKKGELVFCGWEYADDRSDDHDINETKKYVLDRLFDIALLSKHYDYYDDSEMFCHKANDITELIDYLKDEVYKSVDFEVIRAYKDDIVNDDEEDEEDEKSEDDKTENVIIDDTEIGDAK